MSTNKSILIIGASGRMGVECLNALQNHPSNPSVHAFVRDPSKLEIIQGFQSVMKGDARSAQDLARALERSKADTVIVSMGNGDSVAKTDVRTANAQALATVLAKPQFRKVHTFVISSTGASTSKIIVGMGIGKIIEHHLKYVLKDHTGQEQAMKPYAKRTTIVRATALNDGSPTGKLACFGDNEKGPSIKTDRADLANWIAEEIYSGNPGRIVNVTSVKQ